MKVRKVWTCDCEETVIYERADTSTTPPPIVVKGRGFAFGSPATHIACNKCMSKYRMFPEIIWYGHLGLKREKRAKSKARRKSKKKRRNNV